MDYDIPFNDFPEPPPPPKSNKTIIIIVIIAFILISFSGIIAFFMFSNSKSPISLLSPSPSTFTTSSTAASSSASASNVASGTQVSAQLAQSKPLPNIPGVSNKPDPTRFKVDINCKIDANNLTYTCSDPENGDYDKQSKLDDFPAYTTKDKKITVENGKVLKISFSEEVNSSGIKTLDYYILIPYSFIVDFVIDLSLGEKSIKTLQDLYNSFDKIDTEFDKLTTKLSLSDKCLKLKPNIRSESKPPYNTSCIFFPGLSKFGALADTLEKVFLPYIPENVQNEYFNIIDKKIKEPKPTLSVIEYVLFLGMLNRLKKKKLNYTVQCASSDLLNTKLSISC